MSKLERMTKAELISMINDLQSVIDRNIVTADIRSERDTFKIRAQEYEAKINALHQKLSRYKHAAGATWAALQEADAMLGRQKTPEAARVQVEIKRAMSEYHKSLQ